MAGFYTDALALRLRLARPTFYDQMFDYPFWPAVPLDRRIDMMAEWARLELRDMTTAARALASNPELKQFSFDTRPTFRGEVHGKRQ